MKEKLYYDVLVRLNPINTPIEDEVGFLKGIEHAIGSILEKYGISNREIFLKETPDIYK